MAQKNINLGTGELTGDGESLRSALVKIEENFTDVYASIFSGDYNDLTNKPATDLTQVGVNLLPDVDDTRDIGSPSKNWNDVYATKLWVNNSFALQDQEVGGAGLKVSLLKGDGTTATLVANVEGYATTADVAAAVQALDDDLRVGTPGALDSLNELAQAINDDPNFYQTVNSALAAKADASSVPNLTSINAIGSSTGNLSITADNYVIIDSNNDGQIEIGRASGVGNVIIGNNANSTDVEFDGNVIFNGNATGAGFTFNQPLLGDPTQFAFDADTIDFGDNKTIDMQNSVVLLSGSTVKTPGIKSVDVQSEITLADEGGAGIRIENQATTSDPISVVGSGDVTISSLNGEVIIETDMNGTHSVFINTGKLTLQQDQIRVITYPPGSSKGAAGDQSGMFAFSSGYIYYCTTSYTDGLADIWKRVAWSSDTW